MSEHAAASTLALVMTEVEAHRATPANLRLRWMTVAATFILPLLVLPYAERPFSTPKLAFLGTTVCAGAALAACAGLLQRRALPIPFQIAFAVWLAALGASASFAPVVSLPDLLLPLLAAGWCVLIMLVRPPAEHLALALVLSGATVACLAVLQFLGVDLFALAGWMPLIPANPRMRVFATLGNPNFVAAFLLALAPLTYSLRSIFPAHCNLLSLALVLDVLALIATGSRASALAALAILFWLALLRQLRNWRWLLGAVGFAAAAVLLSAPTRSLPLTLRGRIYIWSVAAPHMTEHPLLGFGPGSFVAEYPQWEKTRWTAGDLPTAARVFAGPEDRAHNDYLEFALENGITGLTSFLTVVLTFMVFFWRRPRSPSESLLPAATAGIAALLAVALVDFPLHRPAETFVFWTLLAIAYLHATNPGARPVPSN